MTLLAPEYRWIKAGGTAFGAPGLPPRWTSSDKDAVAMAYSASSKVWFTMSHGILNEAYYPTIDRPQMRDLGLLITDEETFFHEEKRDLSSETHHIDPDALAMRTIGVSADKGYTITKELIADPHHPAILIRVSVDGPEALLKKMKIYPLLSPHLDGGGEGNNARALDLAGMKTVLCTRHQLALAMGVSGGFHRISCGYVGASDGWQDLAKHGRMTWEFDQALDGNVAAMGEVLVANNRTFVISLGFGFGAHSALSGMVQALSSSFDRQLQRVIDQWHRAKTPKRLEEQAQDGGRLMRISHNTLLSHEDKSYPGAFIASASIPWGQAKGDDDLGGYHLVWTRDMVQSATALMACDRMDTAVRALVYLACTQRQDGSFAQNFWIDGTPYWTGIQLDEVAFPIILAWRLWKADALGGFDVFPFVARAAGFLVRYAPVTQQERWEENAGYSPSTLAVVLSAMICAADLCDANDSAVMGKFLREIADWINSHLEEWTCTTDGVLLPGVKRHYMRIRPPMCGDPYAQPNCGEGKLRIANREPGERSEFEAREVIDHGFLELVRYGVRPADDPVIVDSLKVVDHVLKVNTPHGPCWRRYNHDGYGPDHEGRPFVKWGQGRAWPLLGGERAHYEFAAGRDIKGMVKTIEDFASEGGMLPEQIWDAPDLPREGMYLGRSSGSAMPLAWAHAEYIKLLRSLADGKVFDRIPVVEEHFGKPAKSDIEVFKLRRNLQEIEAGKTMRVISQNFFRVDWTLDDWGSIQSTEATHVSYAGHYADIDIPEQQNGRLSFTLYWPDEQRWEGRNFDVEVRAANR